MNIFSVATLSEVSVFVLAGLALGMGHFGALRWNARLFLRGALGQAVALQLARMTFTAAALAACARSGGLPLSGALVGMLLARQLVLRKVRL